MREYRYVGKDMGNDLAYGKVTGQVKYCSDLQSFDMLYMKYKPGEIAHGRITSIDTGDAWIPGVKAVYTFENTPDRVFDRGRVSASEAAGSPNQERLFDRHIRFYGERVAAVVAETKEIAEEACRRIRVTYEALPPLLTMEAARAEDAPALHEKGNVYPSREENYISEYGDYDSAGGELVFCTRSHVSRMTHLSMETQVVRARYDRADGKLTIWSGCQTAYGIRSTVADLLGVSYNRVRVIKPPMGGSFGCKQEMVLEPLVAYAAWDLKADVMYHFTREEQTVSTMLRHNFDATVESRVDRDGRIRGVNVHMDLDAGAYQTISPSYLRTAGGKLGKTYHLPNIRYTGQSICTTTPANGSFRSWGSAEEAICLEPHLNYVADQLGMDPVDLRLVNVLQAGDREVLHGASVCNARFRDVLEQGRARFDWDRRRAECVKMNAEGGRYRYGVGMALCSHTSSFYPYLTEIATASGRIQDDGSLILHVPVHDHGCGTVLAMKKIAGEVLEMDLDRITLQEIDTENDPYDYGCYASRTTYVFGQAVKKCCEDLLKKAKETAALALKAFPGTIQYEDGVFWSEPFPERRLSMKDVWEYSVFTLSRDLISTYTHNAQANPGTAAAHFEHLRVDTFTGHVKILHCLSVHDIGKAINPDLVSGQIGSGIQQGIGQALCEEIKIDPVTGRTLITNLKNYEVANAWDMPDYDVLLIEDPEPTGPYGAKGIGEVATAPVAAAVAAAVNHALGTYLTQLPLTPPVILEALYGNEN